jgi:hypothetical protein
MKQLARKPTGTEQQAFKVRLESESYALFDLAVDETEHHDLALTAIGPAKIAHLRVILEQQIQQAVEPCARSGSGTCSATQYPEGPAWEPWGR